MRAEFRSRSILSNSRASASAASPPSYGRYAARLGSFCRSFFNQNFQTNLHPILMRFCLQLGLQNPPKIHPKSISKVSSNFDAILVRFFPICLRFPSLGDPKKWLKRCSVVRNHTFTTFASKLPGKRLGVDFGFHFGVILVPFSPPRELRKTTKNLTNFRSIFF